MSAAVEVDAPAVVKPVEEVKAPKETKPVKEKKPKAPKEKKPKQGKTASHPPYFQMIEEALLALNEKGGSSPYAIAKFMEEKHNSVLPANFKKILGLQLKNQAAKGKLVKIKASYKLSEKKEKKDGAAAKVAKAKTEKKDGAAAKVTKAKTEKKKDGAAKVAKAGTEKKQPPREKRTKAVTATAAAAVGPKKGAIKKKTKKVSTITKAKQPKSIRSPSKRARKATA